MISGSERILEGDLYKYCADITYGGALNGSKDVVDWAHEANGNDNRFEQDFALFSNEVGAKAHNAGLMAVAAKAFDLALNQGVLDSPLNPNSSTGEKIPTQNTGVFALNYLNAIREHLDLVNQQVQNPDERHQNAAWFQSQLPTFRLAIAISDVFGSLPAAQIAREAAITAFILMTPTPEEVKS